MRHPHLIEMEKRLKSLFDEVDDRLEDLYGREYTLHPARPGRGTTSNREQDGLFNVGADFTPGFGSRLGRGYVIDVEMKTLENVPDAKREEILAETVNMVRKRLPHYFPNRVLRIDRDGRTFKIYGDLSLGYSNNQ